MPASSHRPGWLLVVTASVGALVWLASRLQAEEPPRAADPPRLAPRDPEASTVAPALAPRAKLPVIGPGPEQMPKGFAHPHPISPRHLEIQHENGLIMLLNDAMSAGRGARMRELVREYRERHPRGGNQLQEGYAVIAECLENPGDASRTAGERYYAQHRASTLRRFVRRYCIEAS